MNGVSCAVRCAVCHRSKGRLRNRQIKINLIKNTEGLYGATPHAAERIEARVTDDPYWHDPNDMKDA